MGFRLNIKLIDRAKKERNIIPKIINSKKFVSFLLRTKLLKNFPLESKEMHITIEEKKIKKYPIILI